MPKNKKIISVLLIIFLMFSVLPNKVYGKSGNDTNTNANNVQNNGKIKKKKVGKIIKELSEERTKDSKRFQKDDGTYEIAMYKTPVHYQDNGTWKDIDNTLEEKNEKDDKGNSNTYLQNKQNDFKVKIPQNSSAQKLIEIQKDKYNVSWNLADASAVDAAVGKLDENKLNSEIDKTVEEEVKKDTELKEAEVKDKDEAKKTLASNEKTKTLKSITSSVKFPSIYKDVDLQYVINGSDVKENILLNTKIDNAVFNFNLNVNNVVPALQQDKSIIFYDSNDKSKAVFKIEAPFMYDKVGNTSESIDITLKETKEGYVLSVTPDKSWLNSSERVYPVTIDPSMQTSLNVNSIHDTFVASIDSSNKWNNIFVRTGQTPGNVGLTRTYIKFDLPQLSAGDMITNAQLNLAYAYNYSSNPGNQVNVHKVNNNFDPKNINWGSQPSYDSRIEDFAEVNNPGQDTWKSWNITSIAKQWFTDGNNYGLMLEQDSGGGYSAFWSSDVGDAYSGARPQASFFYVNNTGIENYWSYHSQSAGRAGTSYVNDYNGNFIFTHGDVSMSGSRMPVAINHVFNSNDRTSNIGYGSGWRLNVNQRVELQTISGVQYYKYTDEDGTRHYFKNSSESQISDELNLGLTLIKESDGTITIKDKEDNRANFNSGTNDLKYMKDANGNTMTFTYGSTSQNGIRNVTKITDGAGRSTTLTYVSSGILTTIVEPSGRTTGYNYDGNGNLTSITYSDGKNSTYSYDGNHNMTKAANYDGYNMSYEYYGVSPYRVSKVVEANNNGTLGDELSISYGNNITTFTDVKGRKNIYQFDNNGKTISIKDSDDSAEYYQYGDASNNTKLTSQSKLEKTIINLLSNHELEETDSWASSKDGGNGTAGFSTEASYLGSQSIKITKTDNVSRQFYDQWNSLTKGKTYTFSAYVKTVGVSNTNGKGATLSFYYKDKTGVYKSIDSKYINGNTDWNRVELSFTLPNDASDTNVLTRISMLQESGTAYFDSLQLEEGNISNRYNLIDNGDIAGSGSAPNRWGASGTNSSDGMDTSSDRDHPSNLDNNVFKVNGARGVEKRIGQSVKVHGKAGDVYSLGAWAKGYSVPGGNFQIQAAFVNGSNAQWVTFDFNKASDAWQYASGKCIAKSDYSRIDIYYLYGNNANTAYFEGAQLYKEEFGQSYQYDSKGNVVSTSSLEKQNSTFEYNGSNDLVKSLDPKGNSFKYEYDGKHNVTRAISAADTNYSFNYDNYGNPVSTRIGDGANYIQTKAEYTPSGNYIKSLTDSLGNKVNYNYDETKGLLTSNTDPKGSTTNNSYDGMDRLTGVSKTVGGQQITNNYSYENDKIKQITHNGLNYNFAYDSLGNNTSVSVGSQNLITNTYEPRTSVLMKSNYGNGQSVTNAYDNLDRVTAKMVGGDSSVGVTYDAQVQNIGWQPWVSDFNAAGTTGQGLRLEALKIQLTMPVAGMKIKYQAHVQDVGWQDWVYDGNIAGTVGQEKRFEAIKIQLEGAPAGYNVRYQVHVQGMGWMDPVKDGEIAGTMGRSLRIEAIKIVVEKPRYTYQYDASGNLAYHNDFINNTAYRYIYDISDKLVKVSDSKGNELSYNYDASNNISSVNDKVDNVNHTTNYSYDKDDRPTAVKYGSSEYNNNYDGLGRLTNSIVKTGTAQYNINYGYLPGAMSSNIGISYKGYIENSGWQAAKTDGEISGTVGQSLKYQQANISLTNVPTDTNNPLSKIKIQYQTHVSGIGWQNPVYGGNTAGTIGSNNEIQAIKINLVEAPAGYHVWYQAQIENLGWQAPVQDGQISGTTGQGLRLEALRIFIIKPGSDSKNSAKIGTINNNGKQISYTYDANGNIQTITENGKTIKYTYNELNEVIREDNAVLNKTIVYTYDAGGNIRTKVEYAYTTGTLGAATKTVNYGYGDSNWKDKLTSYDGKNISYDAIGNPLNDGTYSYTWEEGRQLKTISGNGQNISYKYNDAGIRTQKVVNGVTTNYHLEGDKVTYESNETDKIYYTYDSEGDLLSMNLNGTEYYYIRNAQGDIIGLFDKAGTQVVAYTYNTWGKLISTTGTLASTVGVKNPYRYRGYRYDGETGLYYLQTRYYNAEWGRFINADSYIGTPGELLSCNMFAYCGNNPVNRYDPNGEFWGLLVAGLAISPLAAVAVTVILAVAVALIVVAVVTVAVQTYRNSHISYSDSSSSSSSKSSGSSKGRSSSSTKSNNDADVEVVIPRHKYPETARHVEDAVRSGHPNTLTVDRSKAKSNRKESLKGIPKVKGKDLDEYPPAMFREGGMGASVRPLSPSDNRGAGSALGHKLRAFPDGTRVRIKIGD